jgi:hypothetical protein
MHLHVAHMPFCSHKYYSVRNISIQRYIHINTALNLPINQLEDTVQSLTGAAHIVSHWPVLVYFISTHSVAKRHQGVPHKPRYREGVDAVPLSAGG